MVTMDLYINFYKLSTFHNPFCEKMIIKEEDILLLNSIYGFLGILDTEMSSF